MSQQLIEQNVIEQKLRIAFRPNKALSELSQMIRKLKSVQIKDVFFDENKPNHRCVTGALAVEFFGSSDNNDDIDATLRSKTKYTNFKYESIVYNNTWIPNSGTYAINNNIWWKLAHMNNSGRSFSEIANWVELEAYRYGGYHETSQPKVL